MAINIPNGHKYTKGPLIYQRAINIPNGHEIYQMAINIPNDQ
jgi:hypothetical protein